MVSQQQQQQQAGVVVGPPAADSSQAISSGESQNSVTTSGGLPADGKYKRRKDTRRIRLKELLVKSHQTPSIKKYVYIVVFPTKIFISLIVDEAKQDLIGR